MGKHNGKARKSGIQVGSALLTDTGKKAVAHKNDWAGIRHTTTIHKESNMQSIIEQNDLSEFMNMADLAGKDFRGERSEAVVITTGVVTTLDAERAAEERAVSQARHAHKLALPRRPTWSREMSAEQIHEQEAAMFLRWRRALAELEDIERLVLTPFEKNLEVWRQLWRVVERSDILVQVVDARDPLFYRSEDLEDYSKSIHASTRTVLLLNKADLLPEPLRVHWANYFDARGIKYIFWSAFTCIQRQKVEKTAANQALGITVDRGNVSDDPRVRILDEDELVQVFQDKTAEALAAAASDQACKIAGHVPTVGLIGFPNVGKSSTINALFGSKKTAVAPTPGKTKHFQTLFILPDLLLCDCPGLVLPRFASSKSEMVAAGVVPIDRLTDVVAPVHTVCQRISRQHLLATLRFVVPPPKRHEDAARIPTATEVLRAYAQSRGWVNGSGLPDETRTGRQLMKDYTSGKVAFCEWPPSVTRPCPYDDGLGTYTGSAELCADTQVPGTGTSAQEGEPSDDAAAQAAQAVAPAAVKLTAMDISDMAAMDIAAGVKDKPKRADHKFNKKTPRDNTRNMRRVKAGEAPYGGFNDEEAPDQFMLTGKRGGLVRALASQEVRSVRQEGPPTVRATPAEVSH